MQYGYQSLWLEWAFSPLSIVIPSLVHLYRLNLPWQSYLLTNCSHSYVVILNIYTIFPWLQLKPITSSFYSMTNENNWSLPCLSSLPSLFCTKTILLLLTTPHRSYFPNILQFMLLIWTNTNSFMCLLWNVLARIKHRSAVDVLRKAMEMYTTYKTISVLFFRMWLD